MPRPTNPDNLDKAIELYLSGKPMVEILAVSHISGTVFRRERTRRGIPPRRSTVLPDQDLARAYLSGASELALSKQYGVSRNRIAKSLALQGIERRSVAEASMTSYSLMSDTERRARCNKGGRPLPPRTDMTLLRGALANEAGGEPESEGERTFARLLQDRTEHFTAQRAIGTCNVDFALPPVAVEILGGGWHAINSKHAERTPYILDWGWHLVMVWNYEGRSALGPGAADYVVAFAEEVRRNPPATCQYRVITGQGELLATCGREGDKFPLEPPPRGALDIGA